MPAPDNNRTSNPQRQGDIPSTSHTPSSAHSSTSNLPELALPLRPARQTTPSNRSTSEAPFSLTASPELQNGQHDPARPINRRIRKLGRKHKPPHNPNRSYTELQENTAACLAVAAWQARLADRMFEAAHETGDKDLEAQAFNTTALYERQLEKFLPEYIAIESHKNTGVYTAQLTPELKKMIQPVDKILSAYLSPGPRNYNKRRDILNRVSQDTNQESSRYTDRKLAEDVNRLLNHESTSGTTPVGVKTIECEKAAAIRTAFDKARVEIRTHINENENLHTKSLWDTLARYNTQSTPLQKIGEIKNLLIEGNGFLQSKATLKQKETLKSASEDNENSRSSVRQFLYQNSHNIPEHIQFSKNINLREAVNLARNSRTHDIFEDADCAFPDVIPWKRRKTENIAQEISKETNDENTVPIGEMTPEVDPFDLTDVHRKPLEKLSPRLRKYHDSADNLQRARQDRVRGREGSNVR